MSENLTIVNHDLTIKEYKGQRVITFKEIDKVHNRPEGTARKRFNENRARFIEREDFYLIKQTDIEMSEKRTFEINSPRGKIFITESSYLMLAKSFTDRLQKKFKKPLTKVAHCGILSITKGGVHGNK